jgi:hypothetical protein
MKTSVWKTFLLYSTQPTKIIAEIAKEVSVFARIYPLNPDVFSKDSISGEVPTTVTAAMEK